MTDALPSFATFRGKSIASERDDVREPSSRSQYLAAVKKNQQELSVASADDMIWQKRGSAAFRETFMNAGISKPFGWCIKLVFVFWETFFAFSTVKSFSAKASELRYLQMFFELRMACQCREKSQKEARKKSDLRKVLTFTFKTSSADLPVVHFNLQIFGVELFPVMGKFPRQKHHDLAGKFGVWHVMCIRIPISCRSRTCGAGMALNVRSISLVFSRGWRCDSCQCFIHSPNVL
jgi:hypothetical protein